MYKWNPVLVLMMSFLLVLSGYATNIGSSSVACISVAMFIACLMFVLLISSCSGRISILFVSNNLKRPPKKRLNVGRIFDIGPHFILTYIELILREQIAYFQLERWHGRPAGDFLLRCGHGRSVGGTRGDRSFSASDRHTHTHVTCMCKYVLYGLELQLWYVCLWYVHIEMHGGFVCMCCWYVKYAQSIVCGYIHLCARIVFEQI